MRTLRNASGQECAPRSAMWTVRVRGAEPIAT